MVKSRRTFLRLTGGTASGITLTGLAGCSSIPTFGSEGLPAYTDWLVAPGEIDRDHYSFKTVDPKTIAEHQSEFGDDGPPVAAGSFFENVGGVEFDDIDGIHDVGDSLVFEGEFDRDDFVDWLETEDYEEDDSYQEYTMYTVEDQAAAVADETVLLTNPPDGVDNTEALIDAKRGETERYHEESEPLDDLVRTIGDGTLVGGRTHEEAEYFEEAVGRGAAWTVEGEQTSFTGAVVFEEEVPVDAVSDAVDEQRFFEAFDDAEVSADGRVAVITGALATEDIVQIELPWPDSGEPQSDAPFPTASIEFDQELSSDTDEGTLTITHGGGDNIKMAELFVRGDGFADVDDADMTAGGQWQGEASATIGDAPAITAGDSVVVGVDSDYEIRVLWIAEGSANSVIQGSASGPDA